MQDGVPEGFIDPRIGGFVGDLGPVYRHDCDGHVRSGFFVRQAHCNPADICHGGWLSTFADVSLVRQAGLTASPLVTISLAVDFLDAVQIGEWVESRCEIVRRTNSMVFAQGTAHAKGRAVLRMNGIFRILRPQG
jgi:uncharacterized protein (TIGR00369 family)